VSGPSASACAWMIGITAALSGCGEKKAVARPQWTVVVSTDAPVPHLADRLLLEVLDASGEPACKSCRLELGVGSPQAWPVSFGVVPPAGGGSLRVRARLYLSGRSGADGLPAGNLMIDRTGLLSSAPEGEARLALELPMACFGLMTELGNRLTCDAASGQQAAEQELPPADGRVLQAGSWPQAQSAPCMGAVPSGMACVAGGVFALGTYKFLAVDYNLDPWPEHLVVLGAFAMDIDEFTVGQMRALVQAGKVSTEPRMAGPGWEMCTWRGASDATQDAMPVNCVAPLVAAAACQARGLRLPTEAEWEYAAGNLDRETKYPWGDEEEMCTRAIVGRGRLSEAPDAGESFWCRSVVGPDIAPAGPVAGGSAQDVTLLGLRNMGGNISEWVQDQFAPYWSECWAHGQRWLADPICQKWAETPGFWSDRGGSWDQEPIAARVVERQGTKADKIAIGFRCAVSMGGD
jgi:formylglycine-generating enzyme